MKTKKVCILSLIKRDLLYKIFIIVFLLNLYFCIESDSIDINNFTQNLTLYLNNTETNSSENSSTNLNISSHKIETNFTDILDKSQFYKEPSIFMKKLLQLSREYTKSLSQIGIIELLNSNSFCYKDMCPSSIERDNIIRIFYGQITDTTKFFIGGIEFTTVYTNQGESLIGKHGPIICGIIKAGNYLFYASGLKLNWKVLEFQQQKILDELKALALTENSVLIII